MGFTHDGFVTTGKRPFQADSFPMRLYQKAKQLGVWNPSDLDFRVDRATWGVATHEEREAVLGTVALFQAGEESVTLDLLPLIMAIAREGRIEEEIYLTTFLFEEAKHTDFFQRWISEVVGTDAGALDRYHTPSYRRLFYEELPAAMWALAEDPSPERQIIASVTYNMIVEGVLAETGYYGLNYQLEQTGESHFPGLLEGIGKLRLDESRHLAYGIYLISRLIAAEPRLWSVAEARMTALLPLAMGFIQERIAQQIEEFGRLPYGYDPAIFTGYAASQYQKRLERLRKARGQSLADIERVALETATEAA